MEFTTFYKYEATGNDFIMIGDDNATFDTDQTELVAKLCDRKFGIGADGLILVRYEDSKHLRMVYFNSDGKLSTMCGNGGRCFTHFVWDQGYLQNLPIKFKAVDGWHHSTILNNNHVSLSMKPVNGIDSWQDDLIIDTGSPHYLIYDKEDSVKNKDVQQAAQDIRYQAIYRDQGINVNFIAPLTSKHLFMRTYERGVEGETLSCGTGVVAAALGQAYRMGGHQGPIHVSTPGGNLQVDFEISRWDPFLAEEIYLKGPVNHVFKGLISLNSF